MAVHSNMYKIDKKMGITDALDRIQEDEPPFDDPEWESMNENNSGIFVMVSGNH